MIDVTSFKNLWNVFWSLVWYGNLDKLKLDGEFPVGAVVSVSIPTWFSLAISMHKIIKKFV